MTQLAAWLLVVVISTGCSPERREIAESGDGVPGADAVQFTTEDGIDLNALKFGSGDTAVVLAHMRGSGKEAWTDVAESLADQGYLAFAFDFRGYGGQEGEADTNLDVDLTAAITAARAQGAAKVFVVGASMGGTAAVAAGAQHDLEGVVAVSAPLQFGGIDGSQAAASVEEPSLFIAAEEDQPYMDDAAALAAAAGGRFVEYDGGAHGTDLIDEHGDTLTAQIVRFVDNPLEEAGATPAP